MNSYKAMSAALATHTGGIERFTRRLDRDGVPYLSYSKLATVEGCPYRYYLEYVQGVKLRPEPAYFVKGRVFHKAAAKVYLALARGRAARAGAIERLIEAHDDQSDRQHLRNAVELLRQNALGGWEVVAVEQPFVLSLGRGLPPCLGVIDLILRREGVYAVIDHKTGKSFGRGDAAQLAIYCQHVLRRHRAKECLTYFDEYRWVNNLDRIRKPAFQRRKVRIRPSAWNGAVRRFRRAYRNIRKIELAGDAPGAGSCYMCPFRDVCGKATYAVPNWW